MDSFELSKIAGAILCALLAIVAPHTAIQIAEEEEPTTATVGYKLPEPAPEAKGGADASKAGAKAFDPAAVIALLPSANAGHGADIAKKCEACHTLDKGGAVKVGPNLWGVVGRPIASVAGFDYSGDLKAKGGNWTFENLAAFIHHPKTFAPGTKMGFAGLPSPNDLADVLTYLNKQGDNPLPLPASPPADGGKAAAGKAAEAKGEEPAAKQGAETKSSEPKGAEPAPATQEGTETKGGEPAQKTAEANGNAAVNPAAKDAKGSFDPDAVVKLLAAAKPASGADTAKKCQACHTLDKGGATLVGPNLWGVVGRPIASKDGFGYSAALKAKGGNWTFESLASWLHNPNTFAPGTKMIFPGLPSESDLANLIAYLDEQSDTPVPLPAAQ